MSEDIELTDTELDEIENLCSSATPGPWTSWVEGRDHLSGSNVITTGGEDIYLKGATIADQDFIAHARDDIPKLIAEIRKLRKELNKPSL